MHSFALNECICPSSLSLSFPGPVSAAGGAMSSGGRRAPSSGAAARAASDAGDRRPADVHRVELQKWRSRGKNIS